MQCGGENLSLLRAKEDGIALSLNYILMVSSITDAPTFIELNEQLLKNFFLNAALLDNRGTALEQMLKDLLPAEQQKRNRIFINHIPQVWLPGGFGFQTLKIHDYIETIGLVANRVHEIEDKRFVIKNRHAVLIYPDAINVPVVAKGTDLNSLKRDIGWGEYLVGDVDKEHFSKRYPAFISMAPGDAIHYFNHIKVKSMFDSIADKSVANAVIAKLLLIDVGRRFFQVDKRGILRFIVDAFILPLLGRATQKIVLINTLKGHNDLSDMIKQQRGQKGGFFEPYNPLEKLLLPGTVVLNNVVIITKGKFASDEHKSMFLNDVDISFVYEDVAWGYHITPGSALTESYGWNFREIDFHEHKEFFDKHKRKIEENNKSSSAVEQKSIPEVIEQTLQKIGNVKERHSYKNDSA